MHGLVPEGELGWLLPRLSLVCDVSFNCLPVAALGDRGEIVAVTPELAAPQLFA